MSEKSFALASVSVAIIWGTFFYPPTRTAQQVDTPVPVTQDMSNDGPRDDQGSSRPPGSLLPLAAMNTSRTTAPTKASHLECALAGTPGCAPPHKLAGH